ncbi:MAG TPA: TonB-dependent receptor [Vicinamibacterales bacterium]|nr:TonB-dependent receptor [Vicinamibacterales bacterium]
MSVRNSIGGLLLAIVWACGTPAAAAKAQAPAGEPHGRITGIVRDEFNGVALPGVLVEIVGRDDAVHTDVDGRYLLQAPQGTHRIRVALDGYEEKTVSVEATAGRTTTADVVLHMARLTETVTVTARVADLETSSAEAQLIERERAPVITDNLGAQEMRQNGDSDAAAALQRVTGLSLVDGQYVFVRGLGERYSNTTLSGSVLPTTEPDKKVVPLDLFPAGLIDSVQVNKSYAPDRPAEFAGGLVQIIPLRLPFEPVADVSYGLSYFSTATGKAIPLSPLGRRDWLGFDGGARALPQAFPPNKIVRRGIYSPDVGYTTDEMSAFGRLLENRWSPSVSSGTPGQHWSATAGNRFGRFGIVASVSHGYKEQYVEERRRFFRVENAEAGELEPVSDYAMQTGSERAQLGLVANAAYQFTPSHRLSIENFYTHQGRDEGRVFEGPNTENNFWYRNSRLSFVEEGLALNAAGGEHFVQRLANSRVEWRVAYARATRSEPDLREVLYQAAMARNADGSVSRSGSYLLADESQSGFRMFSDLADETLDGSLDWAISGAPGGRFAQIKVGIAHIERTRDFRSRRFRFIPSVLNKDGAVPVDLRLPPEELFAPANIGSAFRFAEETRPVDAYDGRQWTTAGYGMVDVALTPESRLVGGVRVERFDQQVNTFDPFGLFAARIAARNRDVDVFPGINFVRALTPSSNLRVSYSTTVNRPEFRELAEFEFTDVVGNRAIKGNPGLRRALVQNVDARWELFTGGRGVVAASAFYKHFDQPIERIVIAGAQPIVTFQNADRASNVGLEIEAARPLGEHIFVSGNYTFVDSKIMLRPEQRTVQTSLERPLAGQSKHLVNVMGEFMARGFSTRVLFTYAGDRISDVGANEAPDIVEQGRGSIDLVFGQRIRGLTVRVALENLTDSKYLFTQGAGARREQQRVYKAGRTAAISFGLDLF